MKTRPSVIPELVNYCSQAPTWKDLGKLRRVLANRGKGGVSGLRRQGHMIFASPRVSARLKAAAVDDAKGRSLRLIF